MFLLTYGKTYALQVVPGRLGGMGPRTATRWMHGLLPVLLAGRRRRGDAPARSLAALAQRLGGAEAAAAPLVTPREEEPPPSVAPAAPLLPRTGPHGAWAAPKTLRHRPRVRVGSKRPTPSKMSGWAMPGSSSAG